MDKNQRDRLAGQRPTAAPTQVPIVVAAAPPAESPRAAPAAAKPRRTKVAVSELEAGVRADPKVSHLVTTLITAELRRRPALTVTSQDDIKALLGYERQKALLGCTDASCLAEIGGALGVDQMVTGSLSGFGDSLVLVVRVVDVHKGLVLRDATRRLPAAAENALLDAIPGLAAELYPSALPAAATAAISPVATVQASPSRSSAPWWLVGTGAVVAVVGGTLTAYEFATTSPQPTLSQAQTANTFGYVGQSALGVGLAVLISGTLWALLRPAAPPEAAR
jgi:hypothetical protein